MEVNKKSVFVKMPRIFAKRFALSIMLLMFHFTALAQYYPVPIPVKPDKEARLSELLKLTHNGRNKIELLLDLVNINLNKPLRKKADLDRAMRFADEARELSTKSHDLSGYNNAQWYIAEVLTFRGDIKSAENILGYLNDTSRINLLLNLSFKYWLREKPKKEDDWAKALLFAEQAKKLSVRYHLPAKEILALKDIAMVHADQGKVSAETELLQIIERYKAINYPYLHYTYYQLAEINWQRGNPDKAVNYINQTINTMKATGDSIPAGDFYVMRGNISLNDEDYKQGAYFYDLAVKSYKIHAGRASLADRRIFSLVPRALRKLKRYGEALRYIRKAMQDYPPLSPMDEIDYDSTLGNIYRDMKIYDKAADYFLKALAITKKQGLEGDMSTYRDIGQLYVESGQYAKARPYLDRAWKTFGNQMSSAGKSHMNYMLYLVDSAAGNYRSAMNHLADFRGLEEFNLRQAQNKEVRRLEVQYGVKEKEDALKIKDQHIALLDQNYKLEQIKLKQSRMEKNIIIGAIVVLVIFTVLLYNQYQNKKRANQVTVRDNEVIINQNVLINQKNRHLELLLQEKEWLIKEVHHRVKNNLQTIISLLQSQAAYLENDALEAIQTSQNRIYTMSLIHQKLYRSEDIQTINMAGYIPELIKYLKDSFDSSRKIKFNTQIDKVHLDASVAIPIALIINEALTNSIKYAFPEDRQGEITVSLHDQDGLLRLELYDNGIGMDKDSIKENPVSLGWQLIMGLTKEIRGEVSIKGNHGVEITILFKKQAIEYANILADDLINPA